MAQIQDTFVASATYNGLPHIREVSEAPENDAAELENLRTLLAKHGVSRDITIRLIHKHFDITDDEIMVFKHLSVPSFGTVKVMKPVQRPAASSELRGIHYFVNDEGTLQSYEYGDDAKVPDMSGHQSFLTEFCDAVVSRGLQHKFGLKLQCETSVTGWTEFEFPGERSTIMIPEGMPTPQGQGGISVVTEWPARTHGEPFANPLFCRRHSETKCKNHHTGKTTESTDGLDGDWYLGGQKIEPGTPIHSLVAAVVEVW